VAGIDNLRHYITRLWRNGLRDLASAALRYAPKFRFIYVYIPPAVRQGVKAIILRQAFRRDQDTRVRPGQDGLAIPATQDGRSDLMAGALLIGYPKAELGTGQHVRMTARALLETPIKFGIFDFNFGMHARQEDHRFANLLTTETTFATNVFHITADQMILASDFLGSDFFLGKYNILYPFWELAIFPDECLPALNFIQEVWAPSRFIQEAIAKKVAVPTVWMPVAVDVPDAAPSDRNAFGIAEDTFVFLFHFDFASYPARKNPWAVIDAFHRAFPDSREKVQLVIKFMALDWHKADVRKLYDRVKLDPRIILVNEVLSMGKLLSLMNSANAFVSLHRSEGFGLGMAESMALGKPVIGTNYSGNTDFMNDRNSCLVNYSLVPVKNGDYPYSRGQVWAEPDIDHAVWHMKRLVSEPKFARRMGDSAKSYMAEHYSPKVISRRYVDRLTQLGVLN